MACTIVMIRCSTHYPRHVVVNRLSIKLWSWHQASWIAIIIIQPHKCCAMMRSRRTTICQVQYFSVVIIRYYNWSIQLFAHLFLFINLRLSFCWYLNCVWFRMKWFTQIPNRYSIKKKITICCVFEQIIQWNINDMTYIWNDKKYG